MDEIVLDEEEINSFINDHVPRYQASKVRGAFVLDQADLEILGRSLVGEKDSESFFIKAGGPGKNRESVFDLINREIYKFFCTDSEEYSSERFKAGFSLKQSLTLIATAIAAQLGVSIGVAAGALTVAMLAFFKVGKNAWCEYQRQ